MATNDPTNQTPAPATPVPNPIRAGGISLAAAIELARQGGCTKEDFEDAGFPVAQFPEDAPVRRQRRAPAPPPVAPVAPPSPPATPVPPPKPVRRLVPRTPVPAATAAPTPVKGRRAPAKPVEEPEVPSIPEDTEADAIETDDQ